MAYLKFQKQELVNLEYALKREILATNRTGGYAQTTIVGCNTRKYHGLLVVPIEAFGGENYVLLSGLDETLIQHDQAFNLGIHRYPGVYEPRGHKYIVDFEIDRRTIITYRVGGMLFQKEIMLMHNKDQMLLRYTLLDAHSATTLRLKPYLAFRQVHTLTKANPDANPFHGICDKGISCKLYSGFPDLYMQLNVNHQFVSCPDWYKDVEYEAEKQRGYDYQEDLFVPGYFECPIRKGQSIVFSASLKKENPARFKAVFDKEVAERHDRASYESCLELSADQFVVHHGGKTEVVAGYPWFGRWGRDTFIALPGLTLASHYDPQACREVLDTMVKDMRGGLFPNIGQDDRAAFNSVDAPLWFFWTLQQYMESEGGAKELWAAYGPAMKEILRAYKNGTSSGIVMHRNGLIWASQPGKALTWMDAVVHGEPVTPRAGYAVEINALWYNAVKYALDLCSRYGKSKDDKQFVAEFLTIPDLIETHYYPTFWCEHRRHLADYVDENGQNMFTRPNQIIACSLPYSPISEEVRGEVMKACTGELLTTRGLRTLSPRNPLFVGVYEGDQETRDRAYHQGTVWPWLIGPYAEAMFKLYGASFVPKAQEIVQAFEEDINVHGVASIAEIYDGNPPYLPHGCPSQAWSVASVLRTMYLIRKYKRLAKQAPKTDKAN